MNPKDIRKQIGINILLLRKKYGISRKTLAELAHIPIDRLRRLENCDTDTKLYDFHLKRLGEIFDISVDTLFEKIT